MTDRPRAAKAILRWAAGSKASRSRAHGRPAESFLDPNVPCRPEARADGICGTRPCRTWFAGRGPSARRPQTPKNNRCTVSACSLIDFDLQGFGATDGSWTIRGKSGRNSTPVLLHLLIAVATSAASDPSPRRWGRKRRFRSLCSRGWSKIPPKKKVEGCSKAELPVHFRLAGRSAGSMNVGQCSRKATAAGRLLLTSIRGLGGQVPPHKGRKASLKQRAWVFYPMDLRPREIARPMYPSAGG